MDNETTTAQKPTQYRRLGGEPGALKTGEVLVEALVRGKHYTIIQDDTMLITAYEVVKDPKAMSNYVISLGQLGHVEDFGVQELILNKLKTYSSPG